ncbi:MAG TPA: hypothetical protein VNM15_01105 [Candidatus Binatia bacterium]|nr:hypothetical protein [Candidatus Binatia bacterium]
MRGEVKAGLLVLSLVLLYWPGIRYHWEAAHDPYFAPYDAAQYIPAFFKFDRNDPIPTSYVKEYFLNAICPPLYRWFTAMGAELVDVRYFQLVMTYLAYGFFLAVIGRLGWVLGGASLSLAVLAVTISAWIFIGLGFIGGAPRMYAYPLMALILYSLILDRPYVLAVTVVLGGWLYPIVGVIGGSCLAGWMLLRVFGRRGTVATWTLRKRLLMLTAVGGFTALVVVPMILGSQPYGRRVVEADITAYPEAGPDGNYRPYDQLPYKLFGTEVLSYFVGPLYSHGSPIAPTFNIHKNLQPATLLVGFALAGMIIIIVILRGMRLILKGDHGEGGLRVIGFVIACCALHIVAWLAAPYMYIPTRYFMFSLPFLISLVFPWCVYTLLGQVRWLEPESPFRPVAFLAIIGLFLAVFGGRGDVGFAANTAERSTRSLYDAIAALPKDAVIAGWPVGPIRKMEYVTRRNAFLTGDLHQVLHLEFMKAMRERMDAVFDAYLSADATPLYRLREKYGVTHLIVETRDFTDPEHAPEYFAPWRSRIPARLAEIKGKEFLLNRTLHEKAAIFNRDGLILIDLARLP